MRREHLEDRITQYENEYQKKLDQLEERIRQVNMKFDRVEQLSDRLESLNKLIDSLKINFDAKLSVYEEKFNQLNLKFSKIKIDELNNLVRKTINNQKCLQNDFQKLQELPSQSMILKQSNLQSPNVHQRIESYQKNDRLRSITLEKEKLLEQRLRQETEEDHIDKFQFTLQSKVLENNENILYSKKQKQSLTLEAGKQLLERTISQDHMQPRSKYLSSTNCLKNSTTNLRNLRK
ncbi:hypothetical protein pb186bvf_018878 [Paramecium bursaria]